MGRLSECLRGCLDYRVFRGAAFTTRLSFQHTAFSAFHSVVAGYFSATGRPGVMATMPSWRLPDATLSVIVI
jgi:hypothetical protein